MEREHHYGAGSAEDRQRAAFQPALNAELHNHSMQTFQMVPFHGFPFQNMRPVPYQEQGHAIPQNFAFTAVVTQIIMAGGSFMPPTNPSFGMPVLVPPMLPAQPGPQTAHWQMMHRAPNEMEQARARYENRAYGPGFGGGPFFGGSHAPYSNMQTTGPPRHAGIFQHRTMTAEDLHSQTEAVAQPMTRAEASKPYGAAGLSAFPPNTGFMNNQLDYSGVQPPPQHFHQPGFAREESPMMSNNPLPTPPRSVSGDLHQAPTFYRPYQDTMAYGDSKHHTVTGDFWQKPSTTPVTSSHNNEPGRYDTPQVMQPESSAYNPIMSSSQQHNIYTPYAGALANPSHEMAATPSEPLPPSVFCSPWSVPSEESHTQQEPSSYQAESVSTNCDDTLNKRIHEVAEIMTRFPNFDDATVKESDDNATENTVPHTETNRQTRHWFRSAARGRRNATGRQPERYIRIKGRRFAGEKAGRKEIEQAVHDSKDAKETCIKEIALTDTAKVIPPAEEKISFTETEEADDDIVLTFALESDLSENKEEAAEDTE